MFSCLNAKCIFIILFIKGQIFALEHMEVYHTLEQVSGEWRDIGKELGIPGKMLQALQNANLPPEQCCAKVIEEWLIYSGDEPSWYSLTKALRKLHMEQQIDKIMMKWGKSLLSLILL